VDVDTLPRGCCASPEGVSSRKERRLSGPTWLSRTFAAVMIAVALYHAARIVRSRMRAHPIRYDVDLTHLGMGVAMATMLLATLSRPWSTAWAIAFAVPTLWFAWCGARTFVFDGAHAAIRDGPHALACGAMLYMLAVRAVPSPDMAGMSMPGTSGSSFVALPFAMLMLGVATQNAARLRQPASSPALAHGCQLAMSSTMVYMLATML
jgi:hypothetical protein